MCLAKVKNRRAFLQFGNVDVGNNADGLQCLSLAVRLKWLKSSEQCQKAGRKVLRLMYKNADHAHNNASSHAETGGRYFPHAFQAHRLARR